MKALPGRKTDVKDSELNAKLLRHGLLKASFIPNRNQRELRELVRYRRSIIEERSRQHNRIQQVLKERTLNLALLSQILGSPSLDMLLAIADGEYDPEKLASFARRSLKRKRTNSNLLFKAM
ncbi:IS110 family transposase [Paenibacillus sedimenti]|uniref:IS110 family transposase n=1 Tax=Paenibacillus sedimenti TaxID=2770274 RepID=UPI001CB74D03|nr:IS110 family transposase [Paenibacillus sedimenti]